MRQDSDPRSTRRAMARKPGALLLAACAAAWGAALPAQAQTAAAPPPAVLVQPAEMKEMTAQRDFLGRVHAADKVELRARVEGFLEKRLFTEGGFVKEGELLFQIDKAPFRAEVEQREADLAAAQAVLKNAEVQLARAEELIGKQAVAQTTLDQRTADEGKAKAEVMKAQAALRRSKINMSWTDVSAPFAGRIGPSQFSIGDVVGPSTPSLATLVRTDPMNVTFPVTQREYLRARGGRSMDHYKVRLILADKSLYAEPGVLELVDVQANEGTDSVTLRARVPNPTGILIAGMSVSVRLEFGEPEKTLVIPFTAVAIDQQGPFVLTVGDDNRVARRNLKIGSQTGGLVVVQGGLNPGDRVIVEGQQRARPGGVVAPTLWSANTP
ncbi:MAG: efflux RND transporter periplasmic adaptor subunit [Beijerinckiaceae bacterium]|nr:efflux RND transporter periplasmic adaptor subunit [Beijerinckiaceae bacterium]